jgi:4-hydroxybenzoate polyprenyltransferase
MRLHQWLKNLLVFVPLAGAHQLHDLALLWQATIAFLPSACARPASTSSTI